LFFKQQFFTTAKIHTMKKIVMAISFDMIATAYTVSTAIPYLENILIIATIIKKTSAMENGIHNGANTHHQDQAITLHSFNTRNTMNKTPQSPIPPPPLSLSDISPNLLISIRFYWQAID
jgi:hypothetical protein